MRRIKAGAWDGALEKYVSLPLRDYRLLLRVAKAAEVVQTTQRERSYESIAMFDALTVLRGTVDALNKPRKQR